jgi:hypothetical protein
MGFLLEFIGFDLGILREARDDVYESRVSQISGSQLSNRIGISAATGCIRGSADTFGAFGDAF